MTRLDAFDAVALPTPLLVLDAGRGTIFGKAEFVLPSGSIKHRSIPPRLFELRRGGVLGPGRAVVIHSAGSAAVAAAWAGARGDLRVHAVVPRDAAEPMLAALGWLGAAAYPVASAEAADFIAALCEREGAYFLDQFADVALRQGYAVVADEIAAQCPDVDAVVVGVGTGGSVTGIAARLRELRARCHVFGVEPDEARVTQGRPWAPHGIPGLAPPATRTLFDAALVDEVVPVPTATAWQWARRLARDRGVLVGPSSGATVAAAHALRERGYRRIVAILSGALAEVLTLERLGRYAHRMDDER